jgi:transcriptional regulator with XRE-family HTH domain
MLSLYERTQEIRQATGWTLERIGAETGLGLSTVSRILRIPGYTGNLTSRNLIVQVHEDVVKSPFPRYLDKFFNHYDLWKDQWSQREFSNIQMMLEALLSNHKHLGDATPEGCRLNWLLGHIEYDRAFYLRQDPSRSAARALAHYNAAMAALGERVEKPLMTQKHKLEQCLVSTRFNSCQPGTRAHNPKIRDWLDTLNYIDSAKAVLHESPWNWLAARNGLIVAAILQDKPACLFFWQALQSAHKQFKDPYFKPTKDLFSVAQDPDLGWFVEHVLKEQL